jgi:hypothetical protein
MFLRNVCRFLIRLHGIISHKIELLIIEANFEVTLRAWRWRRYVPPKRLSAFIRLHGIVSQKIKLLIIKANTQKSLILCTLVCRLKFNVNLTNFEAFITTVTNFYIS